MDSRLRYGMCDWRKPDKFIDLSQRLVDKQLPLRYCSLSDQRPGLCDAY